MLHNHNVAFSSKVKMEALKEYFGESQVFSSEEGFLELQVDNAKTHRRKFPAIKRKSRSAPTLLFDRFKGETVSSLSNLKSSSRPAGNGTRRSNDAPANTAPSTTWHSESRIEEQKRRASPSKSSSFTIGSLRSTTRKFPQRMPTSLFEVGDGSDSSTCRWGEMSSSEELLPMSPIRRTSYEAPDLEEAVALVGRFESEIASRRRNGENSASEAATSEL